MTMSVIDRYCAEAGQYQLLTAEQEADMLREYQRTRDPDLRTRFIQANLRLVVSVARSFRKHATFLDDLIQEGNLGLFEAIERFDHAKGRRFSTYAVFWIRKFMLWFLRQERHHATDELSEHESTDDQNMESAALQERLTEKTTDAVAKILPSLNERETDILRLRLMSEAPLSGPQLATRFGCSPQRVCQIEHRLKRKLRQQLAA